MIRIMKISLILFILLFFISAGWFFHQYQFQPADEPGEVLFDITPGQDAETIARNLQREGLIRSKFSFLTGYRLFYSGQSLKAGEYVFHGPLSEREVLKKIIAGDIRLHSITIPEGLTCRETAKILSTLNFLDYAGLLQAMDNTALISGWDPQADNLEGYLFPETYRFSKNIQPEAVIETMVSQFKQQFRPEWHNQKTEMNMSIREIITLASLIEKETSLPEEKPLVSSVFHNRLDRSMRLACDPTIIYSLKKRNAFSGNLTKRHLSLDSPYNTYLYPGLPPGPIANPGAGSIKAALFPADTEYLYFVSRNDGSHKFSSTYREHVNAVNRYQKRRRP
jgi:UPF0755 protein